MTAFGIEPEHSMIVFWDTDLKSLCIGCVRCGYATHPPEPVTQFSLSEIDLQTAIHIRRLDVTRPVDPRFKGWTPPFKRESN